MNINIVYVCSCCIYALQNWSKNKHFKCDYLYFTSWTYKTAVWHLFFFSFTEILKIPVTKKKHNTVYS